MKNSIIIPTYTNFKGLQVCVESIKKTTTLIDNDVWIICNGSPKEAVEWAIGLGDGFNVLSCPDPLGYTKAVNLGMVASDGENLVLLNDDCAILEWGGNDMWIKALTDPLNDKSIAVTGSTRDFWAIGKPFIVFFCAATRREVAKQIGYLDEAFNPGAGEDADFCLKAQALGYKVKQVPDEMPKWQTRFPIWHVGNITCGNIDGWSKVTKRNNALLEERYPRTEEDRAYQKDFSDGMQNIHRWNKEKEKKA